MEFDPPGFLEAAAIDEGWLDPEWDVWNRKRRPHLESEYKVTKLNLMRDGPWLILGSDGPYRPPVGVRVLATTEKPTLEALRDLDTELVKRKRKMESGQ